MRRTDTAPGRGLRSIELWRSVSAARRLVEQSGTGDRQAAIAAALAGCGIDDSLFDLVRVQLDVRSPSPSGADRDDAAESNTPSTQDCVVRSTSGRVSLKVVQK